MTTETAQTETITYTHLVDCVEKYTDWSGKRADAVAAAVEHLDAVSVGERYAYRDEGSWWLVGVGDMAEAGAAILDGAADWYSSWCASSTAEEVDGLEHDGPTYE